MIAPSKRPILIVGLGVLWAKASPELVQLAERLGAPVLTTPKCKGAIPEDHALRAGCIIGGLIERNLVNAADLIVTVGLDAVELQPKPWPYTLPVLALVGHAEPRRARARRPRGRGRPEDHPGRTGGMGDGRQQLGREGRQDRSAMT